MGGGGRGGGGFVPPSPLVIENRYGCSYSWSTNLVSQIFISSSPPVLKILKFKKQDFGRHVLVLSLTNTILHNTVGLMYVH